MPTKGGSDLALAAAGQVERIAASEVLRTSEALCRILRYLGRHAEAHPGEAVKEYCIATEALGRTAEFDPKRDACVRVHMGRLRARLAQYYAGPGARDAILISIPRGAYRLSLSRLPAAPAVAEPAASTPAERARAVPAALRGFLSPVGVVATVCVLLGVLLGLAFTQAGAAARSLIR